MRNDWWALLAEHRERVVCAAVAVVLAVTAWRAAASWRTVAPLGEPRGELPAPAALPRAPFLAEPLAQVWPGGPRDPFQAAGPQTVQRGATELAIPPLPPVVAAGPPPADPWPSLYRNGVVRPRACELTLVAAPQPPTLKSGKPSTIAPRPNDIVQAKGDPGPREGTIRREDKGRLWFYFLKPRGMGHPKNPLAVADLLVLKRKTHTVQEAYQERSRDAGTDADAHVALAQECIDGDLLADAEAELRKAIALKPLHRSAYLRLADLCLSRGDRDGEIGTLRAALTAGAESPEVHRRLGERCFEHGLCTLAYEHFATGFRAAGKVAVDAVAARERPLPADPLARTLLRLAAEVRLAEGRLDDAARMLAPLAAAEPADPAVRSAQALGDILAGRPRQALAALTEVADAPQPPAAALNSLGVLLYQQGDYGQALARFDACLQAAPGHARAAVNAALAEAAQGRLDEADTRLAAVQEPPAGLLSLALATGYLRERQARLDDAIAAYAAALQIDEADFAALCGLGRCRLARKELKPALDLFAKARLLRPADPRALRGVGTCLHQAGKASEAIDALGELAALKDAPARDLARLGIASLPLAGRRRDAAALIARALADPRQPDAYALAGRAYLAYTGAADAPEGADELFRKAQALADAPELAQYAAAALRRIHTARREEFTTLRFLGESTLKLPEGWTALGQGVPLPAIRGDALHLDGRAPTAALRQVVRVVALSAPAGDGLVRAFARFEAQVTVPMTNQAPVGVSLGVGGDVRVQVAVRTTLEPQPTRRLSWRILRGDKPSPWTDVPGSVAAESLKLGLALSDRGDTFVAILRDGRPAGAPVEFPELRGRRGNVELGLFAAPDAGQECLFAVQAVEITWKKTPATP